MNWRGELSRRGVKEANIVIRFERVKDGKPCDCPCCTSDRNERASTKKAGNQDSLAPSP
jgi:hypothetical protein